MMHSYEAVEVEIMESVAGMIVEPVELPAVVIDLDFDI